ILRLDALAAHERVDRVPVGAAERLEGLARREGRGFPRREDGIPAGCDKSRIFRHRVAFMRAEVYPQRRGHAWPVSGYAVGPRRRHLRLTHWARAGGIMAGFHTITAAIVGAGFIGPVHVEGLRRLGVRVKGIAGISPEEAERAAATLGLERAYRNVDELLADAEVRSVHLASPN